MVAILVGWFVLSLVIGGIFLLVMRSAAAANSQADVVAEAVESSPSFVRAYRLGTADELAQAHAQLTAKANYGTVSVDMKAASMADAIS